jgi:mannose-1-phosphate guanylyltransferase/mannose-6-phosphate isomerase
MKLHEELTVGQTVFPVLLSGGSGVRLWPISRKTLPKQFLSLVGDRSPFHEALLRVQDKIFATPTIVTGANLEVLTNSILKSLNIEASLILEPFGKNTAPAVIAAAIKANCEDSESLVLVMPCDHYMPDEDEFLSVVQTGIPLASRGKIVTFGVGPTGPETGFGYIQIEPTATTGVLNVLSFTEKPNRENARSMLDKGNFLWNSGIFLFKAAKLLELSKKYAPDLFRTVQSSVPADIGVTDRFKIEASSWSQIREESIDKAVMEKVDNISCIRFDGTWSDLGDWEAVTNHLIPDEKGNTLKGSVTSIDCENTTLFSDDKDVHLAGLGLKNTHVIVADNAVLVASKSRSQDVRILVDKLREANVQQADEHSKVIKPWGWYQLLLLTPQFAVKSVNLNSGGKLSLQSHKYRQEHWCVVKGEGVVTLNNEKKRLTVGEHIEIKIGDIHRIENNTKEILTIIETQIGDYLGEDDIVRYEDVYGRL